MSERADVVGLLTALVQYRDQGHGPTEELHRRAMVGNAFNEIAETVLAVLAAAKEVIHEWDQNIEGKCHVTVRVKLRQAMDRLERVAAHSQSLPHNRDAYRGSQ